MIFVTISSASDLDLDGVDDSIDRCPDSKITDIVNKYGCKKKRLKFTKKFTKKDAKELQKIVNNIKVDKTKYAKSKNNSIEKKSNKVSYDIAYTLYYDDYLNYIFTSNIYYKKFNLYISSLVDGKSVDNTLTIALYYQDIFLDKFIYTIGIGGDFSTKGHKYNTQYISAKVDYYYSNFLFSFGYKKVFVHNKELHNSNVYDISVGYYKGKHSILLNYELYNSFYKHNKKIKDITLNYTYQINSNLYINSQFTKSLSNHRDSTFATTIGYHF